MPQVDLNGPTEVYHDETATFLAKPVPSGTNTGVFTSNVLASALTDNGDGTATIDASTIATGNYDITYTYTDIDGTVLYQ